MISGFVIQATSGEIKKLRNHSSVQYIEVDKIIALAPPCGTPKGGPCPDPGSDPDPEPDPGDGCSSSTQTTPYGIARVNGGKNYTGSARAWIIDTGIQLNHEDLNVSTNGAFTAFSIGQDANYQD